MSRIGATGTGSIGAPAATGPPSAISGAPAGTTGATGTGAPAGTGAPRGPGTTSGTPDMSVIGAPHTSATGPPAATVPAATGPPAAAGTSPACCWVHAWPPVISGAAAASGLNANAAPHNPALATTLMLNRSTIAISVDSFIRAQISPQSIGAAEPHAVPKSCLDDRANCQQPMWNTSPRRTPPFPNGDVTTVSQARSTSVDTHRPAPMLNTRVRSPSSGPLRCLARHD